VGKVVVINNGIKIDRDVVPKVERKKYRSLFRQSHETKKIFLAVGRLHPEKDYPTLFLALSKLKKKGLLFHLFIAGDGSLDYKSFLLSLAESLELTSQITFLGWINDVHAAMLESDLFVQSSRDEAFGLSVLEAGVLGIPIATTTPGGVIEVLCGHQSFVAPGDSDSLASLILSQLSLSALRTREVSESLQKKFSISRMSLEYKKAYQRLQGKTSLSDSWRL
jgi:glycosyltransferase involved in cell wall biosynthesis